MTRTNTLIRTKLNIPYIRPELVHRPRLQEKVLRSLDGPLTLVTAPAGFGKTTLIASSIKSSGMKVAWLSLDKNDNQTESFLQYLIEALQTTDDAIGREPAQMISSTQQFSPKEILTRLINDLISSNDSIILVLDDYQFIHNSAIHESVLFLLDHCPKTFHLVIISRSDPPLPLSRLRVRAQMVELRASDLSFTQTEAAEFLNDIMGLRLDTQSVAFLEKRTEGWIAGLQMAALSVRDRKDVNTAIVAFSGSNRYILDYLLEEVLANQPPEIQRFLLITSILNHISSPLCDAVMGQSEEENSSIRILAYLEKANIFLIPLDGDRQWYRYHHLFADLLQARLHQTYTDAEIHLLHRRAAEWYAQNEYAYEAIHHASLISDDEWVENLIEQNYMEMFQRKDSASIRAWTGSLSREVILKSPKLSIHESMSLSWIGHLDKADYFLKNAEQSLQSKEATPEVQALKGHLAYVKSRVIAMQGDFQQAIQLCREALENTPDSNQALLGGIGVMLGYGYFLAGDFENATKVLTETIHSGLVSGAVNTTIGAYCVLGRLYALQGKLHKAYQAYQEAEKFVQVMGGRHLGALSIIYVGFAEVLYEWNQLETAMAYARKGLESIQFWGKADDIALAHIIDSRIQLALGNPPAALGAIEKASQVIHSHGVFSEARHAVETARVRLQLKQGDQLDANFWIGKIENQINANESRFENELLLTTLARGYLAQKKWDKAQKTLSFLNQSTQSTGRMGRLIEILILEALTQHQMGDNEKAITTLAECLGVAKSDGYLRIFLDEGYPIQFLLTQWLQGAKPGSLQDYGRYLLVQFEHELQGSDNLHQIVSQSNKLQSGAGESLVEPLSSRELEVLKLIASGKTNQEIAKELVVARGTIKAHAANIYRKLDVTNRTEAVARARQLGILL